MKKMMLKLMLALMALAILISKADKSRQASDG